MIPPFISVDEVQISLENPEIESCKLRYSRIVQKDVKEVKEETSTFSEKYGYIYRVVYDAKTDEGEILNNQIFLCWKMAGRKESFILAPFDEENFVRNIDL